MKRPPVQQILRGLLAHARANVVGYLALFVALGGTGYALSANSVGERQLRNHAVNPIKLNRRNIGGYVRAWATIDAAGHVVAASGRPRVEMVPFVPPGHYIILWNTKPNTKCVALAGIDGREITSSGPVPGYAIPETGASHAGEETTVATYSAQAQPAALPFDVALVCSTPR
jgi:hypothetical protein